MKLVSKRILLKMPAEWIEPFTPGNPTDGELFRFMGSLSPGLRSIPWI